MTEADIPQTSAAGAPATPTTPPQKPLIKIAGQPLRSHHYQTVLREHVKPASARRAPPKPVRCNRPAAAAAANTPTSQRGHASSALRGNTTVTATKDDRFSYMMQSPAAAHHHHTSYAPAISSARPASGRNRQAKHSHINNGKSAAADQPPVPHLNTRPIIAARTTTSPRRPARTPRTPNAAAAAEPHINSPAAHMGTAVCCSGQVTPCRTASRSAARREKRSAPVPVTYETILQDRGALRRPAAPVVSEQ